MVERKEHGSTQLKYLELIENSKENMIKMLQELIAFRSVNDDEVNDMPFGKGVHDVFMYMLGRAKADGFDTENIENYGGHIEFGGYILDEEGEIIGTSEEVLGILGHLDVVSEGNDWDFPPFGGEVSDGKVYGRGAIDNKGPIVASYFAMLALKQAGFVPEKKVRLILGLDEETQWVGMQKYLQKVKPPTIGFAPDAEFPVIHGEKGIFVFELARKLNKDITKGLEIRSFKGGSAANMVADFARVVVRDEKPENYEKIKNEAAQYRNETQYKVNVKGVGKSLEITAKGISSHGARPESGLNAISIMMEFLGRLHFANEDVNDFIAFYNEHIGFELDGKSLGCSLTDEVSGGVVLNTGLIEMDGEAGILTINIRYPVTMTEDDVYNAMMPIINKYNFGIVKGKNHKPIYFPKDAGMIKTLMDIYRKHTGDSESEPIVIGGGTYARAADNLVAFGALFPGQEDVAHKKNEYIEIDKMVLMAKIYAEAIYELSKPE